jgi:hypothetical protein
MIDLLDPTLLATPFRIIEPPPPSAGELELQIRRVRGAFDLLGRELARLEEMVPGLSTSPLGSIAPLLTGS